jgi:uncharacterized protein (TIGR03086 family)
VDVVELHGRCVAEFLGRVREVGADQWDGPTPCAGWTVRDLVNHMVYEERWTPPLMAGATIASVGDRLDGDLLGEDPVAAVEDAGRAAQAAIAGPVAAGRIVHLSFGDRPADEYAWQLAADHLIHAWDLVAATGQHPRLPDDLAGTVGEWFASQEDSYREAGAIGPRPDHDPGDDPQARLLVAFGRDPRWTASPPPRDPAGAEA